MNEFVIFPLALRLRLLGFDEPCLAVFRGGSLYGSGTSVNRYFEDGHWQLEKNSDYSGVKQWVAAPTQQSAFAWLIPQINDEFKICLGERGWYIYNLENEVFEGDEALEKLIDIVEQKKK